MWIHNKVINKYFYMKLLNRNIFQKIDFWLKRTQEKTYDTFLLYCNIIREKLLKEYKKYSAQKNLTLNSIWTKLKN